MRYLTLFAMAGLLVAFFFQCGGPATRQPSEEVETPTATAISPSPTHSPTQPPPSATSTSMPPTFTPIALPGTATATIPKTQARVVNVVDGDTIDVELEGQIYRVRYIGINTPETDQPGGAEATEMNRQLVGGQVVELVKDVSETDQYGRLLRYVYVGGLFVNAELVRRGYAQAATYPPDVAYADFFVQLEQEAREAGRGLWAIAPSPTSETPAWNCSGNIFNCGDFSSCAQVMSYWNACPGDPSRLDGDHDGIPCESLCP